MFALKCTAALTYFDRYSAALHLSPQFS